VRIRRAPRAAPPAAARRPWYAEGLRFACLPACGRCCVQEDGRDYVYLTRDDVGRLAAHLGIGRAGFRRRFTFREEGRTALRFRGRSCPFLDGTRCAVHPARPEQCGAFPFWPESLRRREAWEALAGHCPGIGQGERWTLARIRAVRRGPASG
jgi:hypothetical protein